MWDGGGRWRHAGCGLLEAEVDGRRWMAVWEWWIVDGSCGRTADGGLWAVDGSFDGQWLDSGQQILVGGRWTVVF